MTRALTNRQLSALGWLSLGVWAGCGEAEVARREWQPSDHQPPPVVPDDRAAGAEDGQDPRQRAAATLWGMRCASCHGALGRGDGGERPPGASLPDMASDAFHAQHDDQQLSAAISEGKGLMPAFRTQLTEQGIAALVGYIRTLRPTPAAVP